MSIRRHPRQARSEDTVQTIESEAIAHYLKVGPYKFRVKDVAKASGVSPATVFRYYTRDDLVDYAIRELRKNDGISEDPWSVRS